MTEAARIGDGQALSGSVEVVGQNSGAEGETLQAVYAAFTEATGVEVRYTGTPDTIAIIQSRVQAGNPPDVGDIQLGVARGYAEEGLLVDLTAAFGEELTANFNAMLLETASQDGKVFGVYQGMNPFMVWYNPKAYTGPAAPTDWQEIVDWTLAQAEAGVPVWCAAQGAGAGSPARRSWTTSFSRCMSRTFSPNGAAVNCPGPVPRCGRRSRRSAQSWRPKAIWRAGRSGR